MKRSLIYILVVLIIAGWIGTLISRDPGYVLISYDGTTLETGVWVMLAILLVVMAVAYYAARFLGVLQGTRGAWQGWRKDRQRTRAEELTEKGIICFQAGEYERAEQLLMQGTDAGGGSVINYIFAARAADAQGNQDKRDRLLDQAIEVDPTVKQSVAIARADMLLNGGQWQACLESLRDCRNSERVVNLKKDALFELRDWQGMIELLPALRKVTKDSAEAFDFEKRVALARLSEDVTDEAKQIVYKKLQKNVRQDPDIVLAVCRHSADEEQAEKILRGALKSNWSPRLVIAYGELGTGTLAKRIKTAKAWLKQHTDDYALQLCLGELYRLNGDPVEAKEYYQKSLNINPTPEASARLAEMLSFEGDYVKSNDYFRQALKLTATSN
ncbi:MAG: heme biosynthesis HemY N-terminal domain-containing protein [Pseudomonadales bacterium]